MNKWQPIETAPDDAEDILVFDGTDAIIAFRCYPFEANGFKTETHKYYTYADGPEFVIFYPTHWMPLPTKPKEQC